MNYTFWLGITAACLTTAAFLPQVIKARQTKHTKDLSIGMYIAFNIGIALWVIYGVLMHAVPVIIANTLTLILSGYLLLLKIRYG